MPLYSWYKFIPHLDRLISMGLVPGCRLVTMSHTYSLIPGHNPVRDMGGWSGHNQDHLLRQECSIPELETYMVVCSA